MPGGKLYNAEDRFAHGTIACKIRNSFTGASTELAEELEKYTTTYKLSDLMDFSLPTFNLALNPNAKIETKIQSKYGLVRLNDSKKFNLSIGRRILSSEVSNDAQYPVFSANVKEPFGKINRLLIIDFSLDSVLWGIDGDWMVSYIKKDKPFFPTDHCGVLRVLDKEIEPYYVALALEIIGGAYGFSRTYRASTERIATVQIPLPPIDIQRDLVEKCEEIDKEFNSSRMTIETYRKKVSDIFSRLEIINKPKMKGN